MSVAPSPISHALVQDDGAHDARRRVDADAGSGEQRRVVALPRGGLAGEMQHHALVHGEQAPLRAQVHGAPLEGQVPARHPLGGEHAPEAGQGPERQIEGHAQAGHRDQRAGDAGGEGPRDGVVVALDAPDAARGVGVHVLLRPVVAVLQGHEVPDAARVVVFVQPRERRVLGVEGEAGGIRHQQAVRRLVAVEALREGGESLHRLQLGADRSDGRLVPRIDLELRRDHGRRGGDHGEARAQVAEDGPVTERGQEEGTPVTRGKERRTAVEKDGKGPHGLGPAERVISL